MDGSADILQEAFRQILTQPSGAIIVILLLANGGQYFLGRRDNAKSSKELAAEKLEHLEDVKKANERERQFLELTLIGKRPRSG